MKTETQNAPKRLPQLSNEDKAAFDSFFEAGPRVLAPLLRAMQNIEATGKRSRAAAYRQCKQEQGALMFHTFLVRDWIVAFHEAQRLILGVDDASEGAPQTDS